MDHHTVNVGQYYCWNRLYDINLGRWTTPDPVATPWWNLSDYALQAPIGALDAIGLSPPGADLGEAVLKGIKDALKKLFAISYGNYCGPGNKGGEPIDAVDKCCKEHDECFERAGIDAGSHMGLTLNDKQAAAAVKCNETLIDCVKAAKPKVLEEGKIYSEKVIALFKVMNQYYTRQPLKQAKEKVEDVVDKGKRYLDDVDDSHERARQRRLREKYGEPKPAPCPGPSTTPSYDGRDASEFFDPSKLAGPGITKQFCMENCRKAAGAVRSHVEEMCSKSCEKYK